METTHSQTASATVIGSQAPLFTDAYCLSLLTRKMFHSGFNKALVDERWPAFEATFHGFEPERVSLMSESEVLEAFNNSAIIRHKAKIRATVYNSKHFVSVAQTHGTWTRWLHDIRHLPYEQLADTLCSSFQRCGPNTVFYFLLEVGFVTIDDKPEGVR